MVILLMIVLVIGGVWFAQAFVEAVVFLVRHPIVAAGYALAVVAFLIAAKLKWGVPGHG